MSHSAPRTRRRRGLLAAAVLVALCATLLLAAVAAASASPAPSATPTPSPTATPTQEPSPATTVTCGLAPATVIYGETVTVSGVVTPAVAGQEVAVALAGVRAGSALTDAAGAFSVEITPKRSGVVVARLLADGAQSESAHLGSSPR